MRQPAAGGRVGVNAKTVLRLLFIQAILVFFSSCQTFSLNQPASGAPLLVFAAASLTDAFPEIGAAFQEQHSHTEMSFNFGGSQQLAQQLIAGAPGDLFASADYPQMQRLIDEKLVAESEAQPFAANRLVVVFPADSADPITDIQDLARPGLRLVVPAAEVPAGRYAMHFLDNAASQLGAAYRRQVLANIVSYELNVRAVLTKVALGEADAGIAYDSDVHRDAQEQIASLPIPPELNVEAIYYLAPIGAREGNSLARDFITFILSREGQAILQQHGFVPLAEATRD